MTNREEEVLQLIKKNPLISQNELADILGITRSSVAVHITNLIKKGYITGRGYVLNSSNFISIIGGSNIDIVGFSTKPMRLNDSNPGTIKISLGGVGRNIGENLARMDVNVKLISVIGDDVYGKKIVEEGKSIGLDLEHSIKLQGQSTSTYMSVLDESGDMKLAISDMDIFDNMNVEFIKQKKEIIESSRICIIDTNIPKEVIEYVVNNFKGPKFFLDTVSTAKCIKIKDFIGKFHTIKPNKFEAEILSGIAINDEKDVHRVGEYFIKQGVENVFISLGKDGVYYNSGDQWGFYRAPKINVLNANGAGDAFLSGLVFSAFNESSLEETLRYSTACSIMAITYKETINPNISEENINKIIKELELC